MSNTIPLIPEPSETEAAAAIWQPKTIAEIKAFYEAYCRNCVAHIDYEIMRCDAVLELSTGQTEQDESIKISSSGQPKCDCFNDYYS